MTVQGRSFLKDHTLEEVQEAFMEAFGRVKEVAKHFQCGERAIYDLLDIYPELVQIRKIAQKRYRDRKVETSHEVLQKLLDLVDTNPDAAARQAQYILKYDKESPYNPEVNRNSLEDEKENADELTKKIDNQAKVLNDN